MKSSLFVVLCILLASVTSAQPQRPKFFIFPTSLQHGSVIVGDSVDKTFFVTVDTSSPADVSVTLSTLKTSVFRIVGSSSFTVTRGTTDTVRIRFKPEAGQQYRDTLFASHNGDTTFSKNPTRITMSGTGIQTDTFAHISVAPTTINFSQVLVGGFASRTVVITNTSFIEKQLAVAVPDADAPFSITAGGGSFSIGKNQTDSLKIRFAPIAAGTFRDTLIIPTNADSAANKVVKIIIAGQAVAPDTLPRMSVIPAQSFVSIGSAVVTKSIQQAIKITNSSDSTIKIALTGDCKIAVGKNFALTGTTNFSLARKDTQSVTISFTPDTVKTYVDTLIITNNSSTPTTKIIIFGQGVAGSKYPKITLSGVTTGGGGGGGGGTGGTSRLSFGNVKTDSSAHKTFTITNTSDSARILIGSVSALKHQQQFTPINNFGVFSLDSGQSRIVEIAFTPGTAGTYNDTIFVTSNDSTQSSLRIIISGTGVDSVAAPKPVCTVNKQMLNFGAVQVGNVPIQQVVTIRNTGAQGSTLNVTVTAPSAPFSILNPQSTFVLQAGQSHSDTVVFNPTLAGSFTDSIIIVTNADNAGRIKIPINGSATVPDDVAGNVVLPESITINPNPVHNIATLHFTLQKASAVLLGIYNSAGACVASFGNQYFAEGSNSFELSCSGFSAGIYYLRLERGDEIKVLPLVITK